MGGYAWSNAPFSATSVYGSSLDFYSSDVFPEYYNYRACGFPVRCVQRPPASGYRAGISGGLSNEGTYGCAWSSAPYSTSSVYGSNLNFSSSGVSAENSNYCSHGFPVRCVQE